MKAIDIAKQLGISKATVSLALNNKPGVSKATRKKILECAYQNQPLSQTSNNQPVNIPVPSRNVIKVVAPLTGLNLLQSPEPDLLPDFTVPLERTANQLGYRLEITFPDMRTKPIHDVVEECNHSPAVGIILFASELSAEEIRYFQGIHKPVVLYDNISETMAYSTVTIDNRNACRLAVDYLTEKGFRNIGYLAMTRNIFNYQERRKGFLEAMSAHNLPCSQDHILHIGQETNEIYQKVKNSWHKIHTFDAYIMESYHLSIGVIHALRDLNVKVPQDVSLVGIDQLPSYLTGNCQLTTLKVPHENRATLTMLLLDNEIRSPEPFKSRLSTSCILIEGNSVKQVTAHLVSSN